MLKKEEVSAKWKDLMNVAEAEDLGGPTPDDSDPEKLVEMIRNEVNLKNIEY